MKVLSTYFMKEKKNTQLHKNMTIFQCDPLLRCYKTIQTFAKILILKHGFKTCTLGHKNMYRANSNFPFSIHAWQLFISFQFSLSLSLSLSCMVVEICTTLVKNYYAVVLSFSLSLFKVISRGNFFYHFFCR